MLRWHSRYRPLQCKPLDQVQSLKHTQVEKKNPIPKSCPLISTNMLWHAHASIQHHIPTIMINKVSFN